jgi:predicted DNA-binding WGR domain protein/very-short-patch-repair endonuclease
MSPLSVSDTLPLRTDAFDAVIFDEASQITLEEAVPSLFRAPQAIVVGDEMQLPPTDFFSAKAEGGEEEGLLVSEGGQTFEYDLSSNSFLNHAAKNMPSRMLGWHYRSRSESLIAYSNWAFYQGRLLTVPDERLGLGSREEIVVASHEEGAANVAKLLERPLSFHHLRGAVYDNRRNRAEARYIAQLIRGLLAGKHGYSLGVVAFSEAQQEEIESALRELAGEDRKFAARLEAESEREIDGQFAGLLVKNLENVQGDERDVMILSICYGFGPDGKMRMNFGPINQTGGERRLNVAFSRAKHRLAIVSSIRHEDITNDYNDGANCLKTYLQYAAACSAGDPATSRRVLAQLAVLREAGERGEAAGTPVVARQIADALLERGYAVELDVGMSHFRCDVAARRHGDLEHRLGVLVDGERHYRESDLLDREMMRPRLLASFGWRIASVLSRDWHQDRQAVLEGLVEMIEKRPGAPPEEPEGGEEGGDTWAEFDAGAAPAALAAPPPGAQPAEPAAAPAAPEASPWPSLKRYFEIVDKKSSKFWEIAQSGNTIVVRFGRIGTNGQTQIKVFADPALAQKTAQRLIAEKERKGYEEVDS